MAFPNPTAAHTGTTLAAMIAEIWSDIVLEAKFEGLTILNHVTDLSPFMAQGGDIVHVPGLFTNLYTVQTQSTQGNGIVDASQTLDDKTLTVNTHKYISTVMGKKDMVQILTKYSLSEAYIREFARLLLQAVEDSLFGLYTSIATNTTGNAAGVITDLHVRTAIHQITGVNNGNIMDLSECAFFFDTYTFWLQLAAIQKFYDQSQHGMQNASITTSGNFGPMGRGSAAYKGQLYGVDVYVSPRVVRATNVSKNMLVHKTAMAFAVQGGTNGMVSTEVNYLPTNLATLVTAQIIYGVAMLREKATVLIEALSTSTTA